MKFQHRSAMVVVSFIVAASITAAAQAPSLQGQWTLNEGASTKPPAQPDGRGRGGQRGDGPRGGGAPRGGPLGRSPRGGAFGPGNRNGLDGNPNGDMPAKGGGADGPAAEALRQELRDINVPPARLTIVQTDALVIITNDEGRTTRLAPNGKKVKNDNSDISRKTQWDGGKLVTEITGLPNGTVTETYSIDPDLRRLHVMTTVPNRQNPKEPTVLDRVYNAEN